MLFLYYLKMVHTEQMTILSEHLYQELRKKNHMYMLGSGVEQIRQNAVTAHKDLISKVIKYRISHVVF